MPAGTPANEANAETKKHPLTLEMKTKNVQIN